MFKKLIILIVFLLIISCQFQKENIKENNISLKITFIDYTKDSYCLYIIDDNKNTVDKWYDTVKMKVLSNGVWKNKIFTVIISESPKRIKFTNDKKIFEIILKRDKLFSENSSGELPEILSGDITFK